MLSFAVESQSTVRTSFCFIFALLALQLQTLFAMEVAVVSMSFEDSRREILIELCRSISEFAAVAMGRLDGVIGGDLVFFGTSFCGFRAKWNRWGKEERSYCSLNWQKICLKTKIVNLFVFIQAKDSLTFQ